MDSNSNSNQILENIDLTINGDETKNILEEIPSEQALPSMSVKKPFKKEITYVEEDLFGNINDTFHSDKPMVITSNDMKNRDPVTSVINQVISRGYQPPTLEEITNIKQNVERIGRFFMKKAYPVIFEF
jgi:hypothetical protein